MLCDVILKNNVLVLRYLKNWKQSLGLSLHKS